MATGDGYTYAIVKFDSDNRTFVVEMVKAPQ